MAVAAAPQVAAMTVRAVFSKKYLELMTIGYDQKRAVNRFFCWVNYDIEYYFLLTM